MSIRELWLKRVREGELRRLRFLIPGPAEIRTVLMSPEIDGLVSGPWDSAIKEERCRRLRAELENILAGERIVCCDVPRGANAYHQIGRLEPTEDNIFDIRSVDPSPGLRIIFHFAEKDVLVTHLCSPRSKEVEWLSRIPLVREKIWRKAIQEGKEKWSILFPGYDPHTGSSIHDYLSNATVLI